MKPAKHISAQPASAVEVITTEPLPTLIRAFEGWLQNNDKSAHTVRVYAFTVRQFAAWFEQTNCYVLAPNVLTPTDLRQYREKLIADGSKPTSINRMIAALRAFGQWSSETYDLPNPADRIKTVSVSKLHEPNSLDKQALYKLQKALDRRAAYAAQKGRELAWVQRDSAIILTLLHTGLRVGELCALKLDDVQIKDRSGKVTVRRGKGMRYREVPLNATARQVLQAWLAVRPAIVADESVSALFVSKYREPLGAGAVQHLLREISQETGHEITPHMLRHSFAKALVDSGVGLEKVAALLGHTSLETTRVYTVPTERDLVLAVNRLDL